MLFWLWPSRRKLKRKKRKKENEGLEEDDGATRETQKDRDSKQKTEKTYIVENLKREKHKQSQNNYSML